jgi:hypothetical protein
MSEAEFIGKCQQCEGTGTRRWIDSEGISHEEPCSFCGADGKIEVSQYLDTTQVMTSIGALQTSVDQLAGVTKELSDFVNGKMFDYVQKIYEIVSKES